MGVTEQLLEVRRRIERAAREASRDPASVALLAVSKGHPADRLREAYAAGQRLFGENYAQELAGKAGELADLADMVFHFIGHLQRNKVKDVVRSARVIETVDRIELATEIEKRASSVIEVLLEVNVGGEEQKAGCAPGEVADLLRSVAALPKLRVIGLMTIPPANDDAEASRPHFAKLRTIAAELRAGGLDPGPHLSMGMSHDFEVAIAEGATLVRVGTAIFGARPVREA
ncbi:MAG: YggS family pyridoxal phosphate-dependent enzyme [Polyangiaceae bacterium]|nr:YggS family pyridoxal phosphate-dependent enzyme [Polyangiaceae bacterium]